MNKFVKKIALRYLWSGRKNSFLSIVSIFSILGIALGVAALITVLSVMDGFEDLMRHNILDADAHAHFYKLTGRFEEYKDVVSEISEIKGVTGVSPAIYNEVMIAKGKRVTGVIANGIELSSAKHVTNLPFMVSKGKIECLEDITKCSDIIDSEKFKDKIDDFTGVTIKAPLPLMIGSELAGELGLDVGNEITIISPAGGGFGPSGPVPLSRNFIITSLFYSGMYEYDYKFIYLSLKNAQSFFSMNNIVNFITIKTENPFTVKTVSAKIMDKTGGFPYAVQDWMDMHRNLFRTLALQKTVMFVILFFIIVVAAFGIVSALIMLVKGKTREIALLRALGADKFSIMKVFMFDGLLVGSIGTGLGMLLGAAVCVLISHVKFPLQKDIYFFSSMPVKMSLWIFLITGVTAISVTLLSTLYPSLRAASEKPADGLRYD